MPQQTIEYRAYWNLGAGWVAFPGLLGFDHAVEAAAGVNGLAWGTEVTPSCSIRATDATYATNWRLVPWYGEIRKDGGAWVRVFTGALYERGDDGDALSYQARGVHELIRRQSVRTPVRYRRPIATETTALSVEDPDNANYQGGLINEVLWRAGGRPLAQAGLYPDAPWLYACDASPVAPKYGWVDGEDAWEELRLLAEAAGGQIYQDGAGTMRYVSPLKLAETAASPPHFTNSVYASLTVDETVEGVFNVARQNFVKRGAGQQQELVKDTTPRVIPASSFLDVDLPIQWGVIDYDVITVRAARPSGEIVAPTVAVLEETAQQLTIRITNPLSTDPIQVSLIEVEGDPVITVGEGVAVVVGPTFTGDGTAVELRLNDSDYIQTEPDARRRCVMSLSFYGEPRPIYTASGCPYDPTWFVGQYCLLTNTRRGIASSPARIVRIDVRASGEVADIGLVRLDGVPKLSDFFVIGQSYSGATQKRLGY